jgi:ABC-2 type transport system ATP-binding protein
MEPAIATTNLTCRYGRTEAVRNLTLTVAPGSLFALLGPNGAGKTTTVRTLMNILRPSGGRATVGGVDSRRLGPRELATIGYVSENQKLPAWMTVGELFAYCRPLYPTWDDALCRRLARDFDLPLTTKIRRLSRGMRVKAALVSSLAYRPRILVLDEPFSGLDPVVRDDLVHGVLELAGQEQWTVLLSSHDLDEVERLVDTVGFLDAGSLVLCEPFADLHARFRRVEVTTAETNEFRQEQIRLKPDPTYEEIPQEQIRLKPDPTYEGAERGTRDPALRPLVLSLSKDDRSGQASAGLRPEAHSGWIGIQQAGRVVRFVDTRYVEDDTERRATAAFTATRIDVHPMTLREIFVAIVRERREAQR